MVITPQPTIQQTMPPIGLQPQQYRQQLSATTVTPQMTHQLAQQVAEQRKQQQAAAQPAATPTAPTGSGKPRRGKSKAKSRLTAIKEGEEYILTVIKPPNMTLGYYDALNDGFLMRRIH